MKGIITDNTAELLGGIHKYYAESLTIAEDFGGPSLYFHLKTIEAAREIFLSPRHIEYIYATLPTWGMHRMGKSRAKMVGFDEFHNSVESLRNDFEALRLIRMDTIGADEFAAILNSRLKKVFEDLVVSNSSVRLVANSKAIHHVLPDLVPPIDRQYTIRFFYNTKDKFTYVQRGKRKWRMINVPSDHDEQFRMFRDICLSVHKIVNSNRFRALDFEKGKNDPMNTSKPKIADNLIIAYVKGIFQIEKSESETSENTNRPEQQHGGNQIISKYARLTEYLQTQDQSIETVKLTFEQVEDIIRCSLPPSARRRVQWWANSESHHIAQSWMSVGWKVVDTSRNFQRGCVNFRRASA